MNGKSGKLREFETPTMKRHEQLSVNFTRLATAVVRVNHRELQIRRRVKMKKRVEREKH